MEDNEKVKSKLDLNYARAGHKDAAPITNYKSGVEIREVGEYKGR